MKILFPLALLWVACNCFAEGAASVIFASGAAQIVGKDGQARVAARGGELEAGDTVETSDGRVQLRFNDGASMSLQPSTRFRIDEFRFVAENGKASAGDRGFFSLLKGGFRTLSGLIGKERREQYKVNAAVATIGIRGTDYSAQLSETGLLVSTFGGVVGVCSDAGCVLVAAGETVLVSDRGNLPRKQGHAAGVVAVDPVMPGLPPPNTVESPEITPLVPNAAPPVTTPTTTVTTTTTAPPTLGPNGSPTAGPLR